ncbi:MAG TPA: glycosyltransferase family 4 protein [Patescibacteria group bacterium]|nr:glycosyltransferase family 4 protein [Patescibacteria group bacterium]
MKIAMIGQKGIPATWGGVENHVDNLSRRLAGLGHEVFVYARSYYVQKKQVDALQKAIPQLHVILLPTVRSKNFDTIFHTLFATIHAMKQHVDVYHFHSVGPSLLSFLPRIFRPHARVITTFHSPDRLHEKWSRFAKFILQLGEWTAVTFAHKTITVSKDLQQYCKQQYHKKTVYIPNGISVTKSRKASRITSQFGLHTNEYFLVVTRLVRHKGVHHLIRAFKQLETQKKLVIVGGSTHTDAYVQELHELAAGDSRIIFTGYQTGEVLQELFSHCYIYVQPSESEGLSVAVLEAASYGRAVLASDIPANAEVVAGKGFLFENANAVDLFEKLQLLLKKPAQVEAVGELLQNHVYTAYQWDTIALATSQLYTFVTSQNSTVSDRALQVYEQQRSQLPIK